MKFVIMEEDKLRTLIAEEIKKNQMEMHGMVEVPGHGFFHLNAYVCSEQAATILGIYNRKSWRSILTRAHEQGLVRYEVPGGHQYQVKDIVKYRKSKRRENI